MTSLTNQQVAYSYGNVLTVGGQFPGLSNSLEQVQDGFGNISPMLMSKTAVSFNRTVGTFSLDNAPVTALSVDINSMCQPNPECLGTGFIKIPVGTNAQRPNVTQLGQFRFNTDLSGLEYWNNTWIPVDAGGIVDSIVGTANQIIINNTTPSAPIISLANNIIGINSIISGNVKINVTPNDLYIDTSGLAIFGNSMGAVSFVSSGIMALLSDTTDILIGGVSNSNNLLIYGNLHITPNNEIKFYDNSNSSVSFKIPNTVNTSVYTLPDDYPSTNGQVLACTTAGITSWATNMSAVDLYISRTSDNLDANQVIGIGSTDSIKFSTEIISNEITYNNATGEFTLPVKGTYLIHFSVLTLGTTANSDVKVYVTSDGNPTGKLYGITPLIAGSTELSCTTLITTSGINNIIKCMISGGSTGVTIVNSSINNHFINIQLLNRIL